MVQAHPNGVYFYKLSKIIEEFALAVDFGSVLVDIHGKEASNLYNFSPFCQAMRANPHFKNLCQKCDAYGGLEASKNGKPHIYRCHAGLTDISFPLISNDQLLGFALFGQVELEDLKEDQFERIHPAITDWKSYADLRQARNKVRNTDKKQITAAASIFESIADYYGKEESHPRDRIKFSVTSNEEKKEKKESKTSLIDFHSTHDEINKAIEFINKNLSRNITLEEVANHVYLSHYYFSRLFKKELGISFVSFLNKQRIEQAKILLAQTNLSIQKVAYRVGYTQPSYFCKLFKKETGQTPASFRKPN